MQPASVQQEDATRLGGKANSDHQNSTRMRQLREIAKQACLTVLRHVPPGSERDVVLDYIKFAAPFKNQHVGRRPGELRAIVLQLLQNAGKPYTFEKLLREMEYEAIKRGNGFPSRIDEVDREMKLVIVDLPRVGTVERKFSAILRHFYAAKNILSQ
ncbi:MAG: hypothetical protein WBJ75_12575 [Pseudohongiellaceae bacterium]